MKERPILVAVIGYIIGILMGLYFEFSIVPFYLPIIIIYLLLKRYLNQKQKFKLISFHRYLRYTKLFINKKVILILIISSFISNSIVLIQNKKYNNLYVNNQEIETSGVIVSNKEEKQYNDVYKIKVKRIGSFYIRVNKNIGKSFKYGDEIYIKGSFKEPSSQRNEGGFDYKRYLKTLKIYGTINVEKIKLIKREKANALFRLSNEISVKLKNNIDTILKKEEASILKGLLLGDISDIDDELYENFQTCNITHILAVSGMHVSYIIIGINLLLKDRIGKRKTKFLVIILLVCYMFITGFSPSIVRATIMNVLIIFSGIVYRKNDVWTSISFSLLLILIYNPFLILNIGLKLSYTGTISIILYNKDISSILEEKFKIGNQKIKSILSVILSAQIGILPIVLYEFNYIGVYFIITNLIVSIIIGPIILIGILVSILSTLYLPMCQKTSFLLEIPIKLLIQISNFSKLPFSKFYIPTPKIWMIILYYTFIFSLKVLYTIYHKKRINVTEHRMKNLIALIKFKFNIKKNQVKRITIKAIILIIICFMIILSFNFIPKDLKIYFVDVGQGDCTFIITPKNKTILIDGGGSESIDFDIGKRTLIPFILDKGYTKIDYIIVSHFDQDHVRRAIDSYGRIKNKNSHYFKAG